MPSFSSRSAVSSPALRRYGRVAARALAAACIACTFPACSTIGNYLNLRNSFLSPNEVGRFDKASPWGNVRPVTWPILEQLDVIDEPADKWASATEPLPSDIVPSNKDQTISPGDVVQITVFDLVQPQFEYQRQATVSESGDVTIQNIGNVNIGGLTTEQAQNKIGQIGVQEGFLLAKGAGHPGPQVTVSISDSLKNRFYILGAVNTPGPYAILGDNYRLLNALAAARDITAGTNVDDIYVIRQGESSTQAGAAAGTMENTGPAAPVRNPLDTIESIERNANPPANTPGNTPPPAPAPGTPHGTGPRFIAPLPTADVASGGVLPGGLAQADLDAAINGGILNPSPATGPAQTRPTGSLLDQAANGGRPATRSIFIDGKWVQVPANAPATPASTESATGPTSPLTPPSGNPMIPPAAAPESPSGTPGLATAEKMATQRIIRIPVDQLRAGVARYNIVIRPGDVINVQPPEQGVFYIMGHVNKPGVYALTGQKITLKEAVAAAGNLDALAIPWRCELWRRVGPNEEACVQVNLQAIFDGEQPDIYLKKDDLLNIGTDVIAPFLAVTRNAYRASYGWGFVYDRNYYITPTITQSQ